MRTTSHRSAPVTDATTAAAAYREHGWTVAETANGVSLITDAQVAGIELAGELAEGVRRYLVANKLVGPVIELPGEERKEIHLVTGLAKAAMSLAWLREVGAVVHLDGTGITLPPTKLNAGSARWAVGPDEARWTPPAVALAAAVRAVRSRKSTKIGNSAAS
ncbi:MAG TPA: hypothetical protein VIW24_08120 [Aldersonia sp.]